MHSVINKGQQSASMMPSLRRTSGDRRCEEAIARGYSVDTHIARCVQVGCGGGDFVPDRRRPARGSSLARSGATVDLEEKQPATAIQLRSTGFTDRALAAASFGVWAPASESLNLSDFRSSR